MISFIVSAYNRPDELRVCLASLALQKCEKEIIVCDNGPTDRARDESVAIGARYLDTSLIEDSRSGYHGLAATEPAGPWLCFPTEDSYYVPLFASVALDFAEKKGLDFVYSDCLYDPRFAVSQGKPSAYSVLETKPSPGWIDKTTFLVKRAVFEKIEGWPKHALDWRDGALAEALVKAGVRHGKMPGINVVHN